MWIHILLDHTNVYGQGSKMVANISNDGHDVVVYDANKDVANALVGNKVTAVVR
jgi:6-phosphogluconate dehydrogenase (decarboxylating)